MRFRSSSKGDDSSPVPPSPKPVPPSMPVVPPSPKGPVKAASFKSGSAQGPKRTLAQEAAERLLAMKLDLKLYHSKPTAYVCIQQAVRLPPPRPTAHTQPAPLWAALCCFVVMC